MSRTYIYDMAVDHLTVAQVSVTTTATALASARPSRTFLIVTNGSANPVYFGTTSGVTTSNGALIPSGANRVIQYTGALWVIAGVAGPSVITVEDYYA